MADIFNEVDEEVRRERLRQLWEKYGVYVVGLAFLIVFGIGGWRAYGWWEAKQAAEAGVVFEQAATLAGEGKHDEAEAAFGRIAAEGRGGYKVLARFRQAAEMAHRDRDGAVRAYDAIATDSGVSATLQDLAKVRAGLLLVDSASLADMRARLESVAAAGHAFRHSARELLAFSAWRAGDATAARQFFEQIIADPETPGGVRSRTEMLMALAVTDAKS